MFQRKEKSQNNEIKCINICVSLEAGRGLIKLNKEMTHSMHPKSKSTTMLVWTWKTQHSWKLRVLLCTFLNTFLICSGSSDTKLCLEGVPGKCCTWNCNDFISLNEDSHWQEKEMQNSKAVFTYVQHLWLQRSW